MEIKDHPNNAEIGPDDLGKLVAITDRKLWLAIVGILVGIAAFVVWTMKGTIETTVTEQASVSTALAPSSSSGSVARIGLLQIMADMPAAEVKQISPGARVYVSPISINGERFGPFEASLATVHTLDESSGRDGHQEAGSSCASADVGVRRVLLVLNPVHGAGAAVAASLPEGTRCTINVVTNAVRPVSFLVPLLQKAGAHDLR
jgi:hypothetical protein